LEVTAAGHAVLTGARERMVQAYAGVLEGWSAEDVAHLTGVLARLREDFTRLSEPVLSGAAR
jgi:hypothetical protein